MKEEESIVVLVEDEDDPSSTLLDLTNKDCDICGIEITNDALPINQHPFNNSTAFLLGNEDIDLSPKEIEICDSFDYILQYGGDTASLNVTIATSIVRMKIGFPITSYGQESRNRVARQRIPHKLARAGIIREIRHLPLNKKKGTENQKGGGGTLSSWKHLDS
ncbi:tRNA (guanosine(18)-2'-O)-methyltransferase [Glycine soja]